MGGGGGGGENISGFLHKKRRRRLLFKSRIIVHKQHDKEFSTRAQVKNGVHKIKKCYKGRAHAFPVSLYMQKSIAPEKCNPISVWKNKNAAEKHASNGKSLRLLNYSVFRPPP